MDWSAVAILCYADLVKKLCGFWSSLILTNLFRRKLAFPKRPSRLRISQAWVCSFYLYFLIFRGCVEFLNSTLYKRDLSSYNLSYTVFFLCSNIRKFLMWICCWHLTRGGWMDSWSIWSFSVQNSELLVRSEVLDCIYALTSESKTLVFPFLVAFIHLWLNIYLNKLLWVWWNFDDYFL